MILLSIHAPGGNATGGITGLNQILIKAGVAVGVILILIGVIKLIMALADENPKGKMDASIFIGIGALFTGISAVAEAFTISDGTSLTGITNKLIDVITNLCLYAGIIMALIMVITLIMAFTQEQPENISKASTIGMVAFGLLGARALAIMIKQFVVPGISSGTDTSGGAVFVIVSFVASAVQYGGFLMMLYGIVRLVMGIREESSPDKLTGTKLTVVGGILTGISTALKMFGII